MIFPEFSLNGKVALVTGGGRGLGLKIAKTLASYGALVLVNGRNHENLIRAVETINSNSIEGSALPLQFDVSDETAVQKAFSEIRDKHCRARNCCLARKTNLPWSMGRAERNHWCCDFLCFSIRVLRHWSGFSG